MLEDHWELWQLVHSQQGVCFFFFFPSPLTHSTHASSEKIPISTPAWSVFPSIQRKNRRSCSYKRERADWAGICSSKSPLRR